MKGSKTGLSLEYSYDGVDWSEWDLSSLNINSGDTLYIRGYNPKGFNHNNMSMGYSSFRMKGGKVSCSGNIMSLIDYKNLPDVIPNWYCFFKLFSGCRVLVSAPELPATKLNISCYACMFENCSSLKSAPELPATELEASCYLGMFSGCSSLKSAPELPAIELANGCYNYMFENCTSLTTMPELPAADLRVGCYKMFSGCTSLKNKPEITESYKSRMTFKEYCQMHI